MVKSARDVRDDVIARAPLRTICGEDHQHLRVCGLAYLICRHETPHSVMKYDTTYVLPYFTHKLPRSTSNLNRREAIEQRATAWTLYGLSAPPVYQLQGLRISTSEFVESHIDLLHQDLVGLHGLFKSPGPLTEMKCAVFDYPSSPVEPTLHTK